MSPSHARPSHAAHRPQRAGRWLAALLVFALLALQALGQAHRALHPQPGAAPAVSLAQAAEAPFGHPQESAECRLFDQLLLADLAFAGGAAIHALPPTDSAARSRPQAPARSAGLAYRARAPPPVAA